MCKVRLLREKSFGDARYRNRFSVYFGQNRYGVPRRVLIRFANTRAAETMWGLFYEATQQIRDNVNLSSNAQPFSSEKWLSQHLRILEQKSRNLSATYYTRAVFIIWHTVQYYLRAFSVKLRKISVIVSQRVMPRKPPHSF